MFEINKELNFHIAQHTFTKKVKLTNFKPLKSESKMLDHKTLRTTHNYAKVLDRKVSVEMKILKDKFTMNTNVIEERS